MSLEDTEEEGCSPQRGLALVKGWHYLTLLCVDLDEVGRECKRYKYGIRESHWLWVVAKKSKCTKCTVLSTALLYYHTLYLLVAQVLEYTNTRYRTITNTLVV